MQRRRCLGLGLAAALHAAGARATAGAGEAEASAHFPFGPVLPRRPVPALALRTHTGLATDLGALFAGRISAVQWMFTGCSATCPIQGALFAQAQSDLRGHVSAAQFVSLSIDPLSDAPAALAAWLRRFDAGPGWVAAAPRVEDVERLVGWFGRGGEPRPRGADPHTGQVYIVDRRGELAYRTASLPPSADIVSALRRVAAQA